MKTLLAVRGNSNKTLQLNDNQLNKIYTHGQNLVSMGSQFLGAICKSWWVDVVSYII